MTTTPRADIPAEPLAPGDVAARGVEGNERLTAWAGAALLVGFGAECITLLNVHWWLTAHILIGFALLPPTAVKVASTAYRFARYYTSNPAYVSKGPPRLLLRIIGPILVLNTAFVLLSGIFIMVAGEYRRPVEQLHELSFWSWLTLVVVHLLAYLWRLPRLMTADLAGRGTSRSAAYQRIFVVAGSGIAGMLLALALMPWTRAWIAH